MTDLFLYGTLALLLLAAAIRLLLPRASASESPRSTNDPSTALFPVHCRFFPQMRQLFSTEDAAFLAAHGSPALLRHWRADRRTVARLYLSSLREDFAGLDRLARILARNSTRLEARQQSQVVWLNLRFRLLHRLAVAQILLGLPADREMQRMTRLLGSLSGRLEKVALEMNPAAGTITP